MQVLNSLTLPLSCYSTGWKTKLKKDIVQTILSDQDRVKLEVNNRKKMVKFTHLWELNNTLLE